MQRNTMRELFQMGRTKMNGYPLHDHTFSEVFWIDEGECEHVVNGRVFDLATGDGALIRPGDQHLFRSKGSKAFWLINIAFQWSAYESLRQRHFSGGAAIYGEDQFLPKALRFEGETLLKMRDVFLGLLKAPRTSFYLERFLMNLFAECVPLPEENPFDGPPWMRQAWHLIQRPEHLRLGVPEFCRLSGRCPEHVSREFHKHTGDTLTRRITQLRMEHAARLLAGTTREIIEVADDVGFESLSHFYACFRRAHKMAPSAYRKRALRHMYSDFPPKDHA